MKKELIGICGLYCGGCDNYLAFQPDGRHLLKTQKYAGKDHAPLKCGGCNSSSLSEHCGSCAIRKCARGKNLLHCGECGAFPCGKIEEFHRDGEKWEIAKHRLDILKNSESLKETNPASWLRMFAAKWTCRCGQRFSYYESRCSNCGATLASYSNS